LAQPFPEAWEAMLQRSLAHYRWLDDHEQLLLHRAVQVLLAEKRWLGRGGLELSDDIKVTIAGQAALLLIGMEHDYYRNVTEILVYPAGMRTGRERPRPGGVVDETEAVTLGEAWVRGPVILSWRHALDGGRDPRDGRNVVYHEFAHKLDMLDGSADGAPILADRERYQRWYRVMSAEFERLQRATERGRVTLLRSYGAESPAEFFAVAVEAFFERGDRLQGRHPELYALLRDFFGQHPAGRLAR